MFFIKIHQPNNGPSAYSYRNQRVALLTQHGKEAVIAPVLAELLGCRVEKVGGFDTDLLGTFTRDIAREGSQLDSARKKARIGMELSGLSIGIASEGAFGSDPLAFMLPTNRELLIWIDDRLGIEVVASSAGKTSLSHCLAESWEIVAFAASINCWWIGSGNKPPPDIATTAILNLSLKKSVSHRFTQIIADKTYGYAI